MLLFLLLESPTNVFPNWQASCLWLMLHCGGHSFFYPLIIICCTQQVRGYLEEAWRVGVSRWGRTVLEKHCACLIESSHYTFFSGVGWNSSGVNRQGNCSSISWIEIDGSATPAALHCISLQFLYFCSSKFNAWGENQVTIIDTLSWKQVLLNSMSHTHIILYCQ